MNTSSQWRLKPLLFCNCIAILLFTSLLAPFTSELWSRIDISFFRFINAPLESSNPLRVFWALANHRMADWVEDLFILGFYVAGIWKAQKSSRQRKGAEFVFCLLLTALTIVLINRLFCRDLLRLRRASPTLVLDQTINLSHYISWISVKVNSSKSLPGDHATTALMFAVSYAYFVRGRLAFLALLYGVFLCLPRLAVGAHWLSDIVVGSGCIALFSLSWAFFTPFAERSISAIQLGVKKIWPTKQQAS